MKEVIETMDDYWLTRDDWQSIVDLYLGDDPTAKLPTATKTAFTKTYNNMNHPMPFITQTATKIKGGRSGEPKPDLEDVIDADEDYLDEDDEGGNGGSASSPTASGDEEDDIKLDKMIKVAGKKGVKPAAGAKSKASGSGSAGRGSSSGRGRAGKKK